MNFNYYSKSPRNKQHATNDMSDLGSIYMTLAASSCTPAYREGMLAVLRSHDVTDAAFSAISAFVENSPDLVTHWWVEKPDDVRLTTDDGTCVVVICAHESESATCGVVYEVSFTFEAAGWSKLACSFTTASLSEVYAFVRDVTLRSPADVVQFMRMCRM